MWLRIKSCEHDTEPSDKLRECRHVGNDYPVKLRLYCKVEICPTSFTVGFTVLV